MKTLGAGVVAAFANITVDEFEADSDAFLRNTRHPTLDRPYLECAYAPMVELLAHLRANGFATLHRLRAAVATSCDRSARSSTASRGRA